MTVFPGNHHMHRLHSINHCRSLNDMSMLSRRTLLSVYFFYRLHNYTSSTENTQTFTKASMNLRGPNPSYHTYLAFIFWDFTCLLLTVWTGRSLKRFNLVRENGMLDLSLLTTTSSLPPISTVLKESRNYALVQNLALSSPSGWTPCECDVNLSTAPVSLYGDRK